MLHALSQGLPPGVLSVISGNNDAVAPLLTDPRIGRAVFTGSTASGRAIAQLCASNMTPVTLELGGAIARRLPHRAPLARY